MPKCIIPYQLERVRVTRTDDCCNPVAGPDNAAVSDCWISVSETRNILEGEDITVTNGAGRICGSRKGCDQLQNITITATFGQVDFEMLEIITGQPLELDYAGEPVGWRTSTDIRCRGGFALEVWQNVMGDDTCEEGVSGEWFYDLWPCLTGGIIGDRTIENAAANFTITATTEPGRGWQLGPWPVISQDAANSPGPLLEPIAANEHELARLTTIEPPEPTCGYLTVPPNNLPPESS